MTSLDREIRTYNILASMIVRGEGSLHGDHLNRALWNICGEPSIQWAVEAAKGSKYVDKVAVITESEEIKKVLRKIKGITLIDRPLWTSLNMPRDYTQGTFERKKPRSLLSQEAVIYQEPYHYILYYLEQAEGFMPDVVVNFAADCPLVTSQTFDRLIVKFFEDKFAGFVFSVYRGPYGLVMIDPKTGRPFRVFPKELNRQECFPLFVFSSPYLSGSPSKLESVPLQGKQAVIEVNTEEGLDIHDQEDLFLANCYMKRRLLREGKEVKWEIGQRIESKKTEGESDENKA